MAENIYSKGTRVWFSDKDQGWISAEVTTATRNPDDTIKLLFLDERGKVQLLFSSPLTLELTNAYPGNYHRHLGAGHQGWKRGSPPITQPAPPRDRG